jgi:UDP-N-acetylglucosamine--N-acetylmuramyl-(pentapeptide) pyrophosphoryl-undecaprenol N-acetylglucosamine transferase
MSGQEKRLMVMAGGTGGHVFPGLAVAHHLMDQGWQVRWLGTADRMEADLVPKNGIEIDFIRISGLRGKGIKAQLLAPVRIFNAWRQARAIMKRFQPDVVLGMGGYVSGPGGLAAWSLGIPVVLHEQNGIAGLTNKWLAKIAKKVMQAFPGAFPHADVVGTRCAPMCWRCRCRNSVWWASGADSRAGGRWLSGRARPEPDDAAGGGEARRCGDHLASER